jgi:hypothetical protein
VRSAPFGVQGLRFNVIDVESPLRVKLTLLIDAIICTYTKIRLNSLEPAWYRLSKAFFSAVRLL